MVVEGRDRAEKCNLVHDRCQTRHQLTDLDAGHLRGDRVEFAAYLGWSTGLEVEHVQMWRTTGQEDHDDALVRVANPCLLFSPQQVGEGQTGNAQRANTKEIAARHPVAEPPHGLADN